MMLTGSFSANACNPNQDTNIGGPDWLCPTMREPFRLCPSVIQDPRRVADNAFCSAVIGACLLGKGLGTLNAIGCVSCLFVTYGSDVSLCTPSCGSVGKDALVAAAACTQS